jgi:hypothetical protein
VPYKVGSPSYFPRARARMIVRFEDYGDADTPEAPKLPPQNRRGRGKDPGKVLVVKEDQGRLVLTEPGTAPSQTKGGPQDQTRSSDDRTFVVDGVVPISAQHHRNGVRQADTLSMTLQFRDFPFDPRAIRSLAVKYFLGCVTAEDQERGARGEVRADATVGGDSLSYATVPDSYTDPFGRRRTNQRFSGFADLGKVRLDDSSGTYSFEFTDNTALLIDQEAPPRLTMSPKLPVDKAIAEYLACFPQFRGLAVEYRPATDDSKKPALGKVIAKTAKATKDGGPTPAATKLSVWDYLTDVVGSVGHVVRVVDTTIVVQRARTLYGGKYSRSDDPFTGREVSGQGQAPLLLSTRMYAYGVNVIGLDVERGWRRRETSNVEVRCFPGDTLVRARGIEHVYRRWYSGPVVRVFASNDRSLAATPHHPVLTLRGWVPFDELVEGDDLVCSPFGEWVKPRRDPYVDDAPTSIREVFDALSLAVRAGVASASEGRAGRDVDFHGDGMDGQVDVVLANRELLDWAKSSSREHLEKLGLLYADERLRLLQRLGSGSLGPLDLHPRQPASTQLLASLAEGAPFGVSHLGEPVPGGLEECPAVDPSRVERLDDYAAIQAEDLAELVDAGAIEVATAKVVRIERGVFSGHVFNLQTSANHYDAAGIVVHNSYSTSRKKTIIARFPEKGDRVKSLHPGEGAEVKFEIHRVAGVEDPKTLKIIAQNIYEARNRNEMVVGVETKNLASFGGDDLDPDALDLEEGDPVRVEVVRKPDDVGVNTVMDMSRGEADVVASLGFPRDIAEAYEKARRRLAFPTTFRLKTATSDWQNDSGVSLKFELVNYVEVRVDKDLPPGDEPSPADGQRTQPVQVEVSDEAG